MGLSQGKRIHNFSIFLLRRLIQKYLTRIPKRVLTIAGNSNKFKKIMIIFNNTINPNYKII